MHGELPLLSAERQTATIDALAALMGISPQAIEVYSVSHRSILFDLSIPFYAVQRLRSRLQSNSAQLCLLKVEKVILEGQAGEIEKWVIKEGKFEVVNTTHPPGCSDLMENLEGMLFLITGCITSWMIILTIG